MVLFNYQLSWGNEARGGQPEGLKERCCHSMHRDLWNGACVRWLPARGEQPQALLQPVAHWHTIPAGALCLGSWDGRADPAMEETTSHHSPPATPVFSVALTQTKHGSALQVS